MVRAVLFLSYFLSVNQTLPKNRVNIIRYSKPIVSDIYFDHVLDLVYNIDIDELVCG